ncbi:MAG: MarR family winged helix-turn-helix transcriptional regulator [Geminicoccaceae bacterium]
MTQPNRTTLAVWTRLISIGTKIVSDIDNAMKDQGLPSLSWYDAILEIEKAGPDGIRPFELKDRLLLPQYGTSRLLDRIEKAGFIERQACKADGRGHSMSITDAGRDVRRRMWGIYSKLLTQRIENRLSPKKASELANLLAMLKS